MQSNITREEAFALLRKYNQEPFHIQHALTVEGLRRGESNAICRKLVLSADFHFFAIDGR